MVVIAIMIILLHLSWAKLHVWKLPYAWYWTLLYGVVVAAVCKLVHYITHHYIDMEPIHIEVLLPAFVLGCVIDTPCARAELELQRASAMERMQRQKSKLSNRSSISR